jgi:hypothetical protein
MKREWYQLDDGAVVIVVCGIHRLDEAFRIFPYGEDPKWEFWSPQTRAWDWDHQAAFFKYRAERCDPADRTDLPPLAESWPPPREIVVHDPPEPYTSEARPGLPRAWRADLNVRRAMSEGDDVASDRSFSSRRAVGAADRRRRPGFCLLIALMAAWSCSNRHLRADGPGAGLVASESVKAFAARPWRIFSMSVEADGKSKNAMKGDQNALVIDGDRYLILDLSAKVGDEDQGRFEPRGGNHVRFRNLQSVMELELQEPTPAGVVLQGALDMGVGVDTPVRLVLAPVSNPPALPVPDTLDSAARLGDVPAIGRLLAAGKGVNDVTKGATPLMRAAVNCHPAAVQKLLDRGADVNAVSQNGKTALIFATECGDLDTVTALIAKKAPVRVRRPQDKDSPLLIGVGDGRVDLVQALLAAGADWNDKDDYGNGLLSIATKGIGLANREAPDLVAFLLERKADPNQRGQNGVTPLMNALLFKQVRVVRLLLDHGADPKLTDGGDRPTAEYAQGDAALLNLLQQHNP